MATLWPIQLPYGLSAYHRRIQTGGKGAVLSHGGCPRWQRLTLQQICSVTSTTPRSSSVPHSLTLNPSPTSQAHERPQKHRRTRSHRHEMSVAGSGVRQSITATATAQGKRKKTPKPQSRCVSAGHGGDRTKRERRKRRNPLGPGTRPGAHQRVPIVIDSDASDTDVVSEVGGSTTSSAHRPPVTPADQVNHYARRTINESPKDLGNSTRSRTNIYLSSPAPYRQTQPPLSRAQIPLSQNRDERHLFEETLVSVTPSPHRGRLNHARPKKRHHFHVHAPTQQIPRAQTAFVVPQTRNPVRTYADRSNVPAQHIEGLSPTPSSADNRVELTLADTGDFDLRKKTAQLMAVAPGLPVSDLYHILVEKKGHFEVAKQDLIRASQAPCAQYLRAKSNVSSQAAPIEDDYVDKEEDMIKIDLDDPVFMWDNDAPATPPPELLRRKQSSKAKTGTTARQKKSGMQPVQSNKSIEQAQRPKAVRSCPPNMSNVQHERTTKVGTVSPSSAAFSGCYSSDGTKAKVAVGINRGIRATSYDLEFIVPDDRFIEHTDESYSESNGSYSSDIDMDDDGTDLGIDMKPEYAYNSEVLSSPGRR